MDKTLIIVLDEFTERVFEYSNVTLFDFGFRDEFIEIDTIANGFGNVDETRVTFTDPTGGFYEVTPDDIQYSFERDIDFANETITQDENGNDVVTRTFVDFLRIDQGSEDAPNHGDWVIETIQQTLEFPDRTEILAIDLDNFSIEGQWGRALELLEVEFGGETFSEPALVKTVFDFLAANDATFNDAAEDVFLPVAVSASFGLETVFDAELTALEYFEELEVPIFQASANEGQGGVDWGSVYQNVINVGAWNVAQNGELLLSSVESLPNLDLAGDGIVFRPDWGTNFGTSFATPRIAAEFVNLSNTVIADLNANGSRLADFFDTTFVPPQYSDLVVNAVPALTTPLNVSFNNPDIDDAIIPVSNGTIASNGLLPREVTNSPTGLTGSTLASVTISQQSTSPTQGPDVLSGGPGSDTISALGGDDRISASGGDDQLDGGEGTDTAVYSGAQFSYTLTLSPDGTTLTDRRPDANGTDTLSNIEFLDFGVDIFNGPFALDLFGGTTGLTAEQFESFIELYIAYFNRAPDAIGLNFWGTAFASGTSLEQMASSFIDQDETRATYPSDTPTNDFATAVYNNVLGRTPDQAGIDFWVGLLDSNAVTRDQFILEVLRGAKADLKPEEGQDFVDQQLADRAYLENKVDIGAYFAVHLGMSDVANATAAMALYDGSQDSIAQAVAASDGFYQSALDAIDGEFLMPVVGVLDTPFIS